MDKFIYDVANYKKVPILIPTKLNPDLKWGMSQAEALAVLSAVATVVVVKQTTAFFTIKLPPINGNGSQSQLISLLFSNRDGNATAEGERGLWSIKTVLHQTQDF